MEKRNSGQIDWSSRSIATYGLNGGCRLAIIILGLDCSRLGTKSVERTLVPPAVVRTRTLTKVLREVLSNKPSSRLW